MVLAVHSRLASYSLWLHFYYWLAIMNGFTFRTGLLKAMASLITQASGLLRLHMGYLASKLVRLDSHRRLAVMLGFTVPSG